MLNRIHSHLSLFNIWTHKMMWWMKINNLNKVEKSIGDDSIAEAHQFDWNQFYAISMRMNRIDIAIELCKFLVINTLKGKQFQSFFFLICWNWMWKKLRWDEHQHPIHALNINTKHNIQNRFFERKMCVLLMDVDSLESCSQWGNFQSLTTSIKWLSQFNESTLSWHRYSFKLKQFFTNDKLTNENETFSWFSPAEV